MCGESVHCTFYIPITLYQRDRERYIYILYCNINTIATLILLQYYCSSVVLLYSVKGRWNIAIVLSGRVAG